MILTARDISQQLAARAEAFVPWLLPNGKASSGNWCVANTGGDKGDSMKIQITGPNAGIWADFAGSDKGDLLNLIAAVKNVPLRDAIKIAKEYLGVHDPESIVPKKRYSAPKSLPRPKATAEVLEYLIQNRKLTQRTVDAYKITRTSAEGIGPQIVFHSMSPAGELMNLKYLAVQRDPDGKKITRQEAGCAPSLFGWQVVPRDSREVIIAEGEIDAMTWFEAGFPALSVPMGAGNHQWIDFEWENLEQFDSIYLAFDADKPGKEGGEQVAARLGTHRCLIVKLPDFKDANEAMQAGKPVEFFASAIARAQPISPVQIKTPAQFRDRVQAKFYPQGGVEPGFFPRLFRKELGMRQGEVTVWTGIAGHGKSVLLNQLTLGALMEGYRCAIASMEMRGEQTLQRLLVQSELNSCPLPHAIDAMIDWLCGKMWIYDLMGNVRTKSIIDLMEYSYARHGVAWYVIDSLMKCGVSSEDYEGQRSFLNELSSFAKERNVHVNLVAHSRKGKDEHDAPGKLDVKGSSDIVNQADNILVTWRNKEKEEKRRDNNLKDQDETTTADAIVWCNKQRESGVEFKRKLGYAPKYFRFYPMGEEHFENLSILTRINQEENPIPETEEMPL